MPTLKRAEARALARGVYAASAAIVFGGVEIYARLRAKFFVSKALFLQVVDIVPVVNNPVPREELRYVVFHELLELWRQIA